MGGELRPPKSERLWPFPDELLDASKRAEATVFVLALSAPPRRRAYFLARWAAYVGVELAPGDLDGARGGRWRPLG